MALGQCRHGEANAPFRGSSPAVGFDWRCGWAIPSGLERCAEPVVRRSQPSTRVESESRAGIGEGLCEGTTDPVATRLAACGLGFSWPLGWCRAAMAQDDSEAETVRRLADPGVLAATRVTQWKAADGHWVRLVGMHPVLHGVEGVKLRKPVVRIVDVLVCAGEKTVPHVEVYAEGRGTGYRGDSNSVRPSYHGVFETIAGPTQVLWIRTARRPRKTHHMTWRLFADPGSWHRNQPEPRQTISPGESAPRHRAILGTAPALFVSAFPGQRSRCCRCRSRLGNASRWLPQLLSPINRARWWAHALWPGLPAHWPAQSGHQHPKRASDGAARHRSHHGRRYSEPRRHRPGRRPGRRAGAASQGPSGPRGRPNRRRRLASDRGARGQVPTLGRAPKINRQTSSHCRGQKVPLPFPPCRVDREGWGRPPPARPRVCPFHARQPSRHPARPAQRAPLVALTPTTHDGVEPLSSARRRHRHPAPRSARLMSRPTRPSSGAAQTRKRGTAIRAHGATCWSTTPRRPMEVSRRRRGLAQTRTGSRQGRPAHRTRTTGSLTIS